MNTFELRDNLRYYNQRFSEMPILSLIHISEPTRPY